jgi:phosphoglycolate phosphatase
VVVAASNAVLAGHGFATLPGAEIIQGMVLPTAPRMGAHARQEDPLLQRRLAEEFYRQAHALTGLARGYDGIAQVLDTAHGLGIRQGVVSNNQGALVRRLLAQAGLDRCCELMWGEEDVPAPKPDPRGITAAATALGGLAGCVFVGDGITDVLGALAVGMPVIGVTWGIHPRAEMEAMGFDLLVESAAELRAALHLDAAP